MIKRATLSGAVLFFGLPALAWAFDIEAYANERISWVIGIAGPVIVIIVIINIVRELLPGPRGSGRSYSAPNVKWTYNPPPPTYRRPTYQPPSTFVNPPYQPPRPTYARPAYQPSFSQGWVAETLYHGTPALANALDITDANSGFIIGYGNASGNGLYLADFQTAQTFAALNGAIVKVLLQAPASQIADLNSVMNSPGFQPVRI